MMDIKRFAWALIFSGLIMTLIETAYFGWNFKPGSDIEMIADLISILPTVVGTAFLAGIQKK